VWQRIFTYNSKTTDLTLLEKCSPVMGFACWWSAEPVVWLRPVRTRQAQQAVLPGLCHPSVPPSPSPHLLLWHTTTVGQASKYTSRYLLLSIGVEQHVLIIFIGFLLQLQWISHWSYLQTHNQKGSYDKDQEIPRLVCPILFFLTQLSCQTVDTLWITSSEYKRFSF